MSPEAQNAAFLDWCDERSLCPRSRESLATCGCPDCDDTEETTDADWGSDLTTHAGPVSAGDVR